MTRAASAERPWVLGVDIGGTNVVVASVRAVDGAIGAIRTAPTRAQDGPEVAVALIARLAGEVVSETLSGEASAVGAFRGAGIGCPGPFDRATGSILTTPNLGWDGFPIRDRLAEALGMPVVLENDANCATFGEWWQGAGRGMQSVVGITLGTGIGGGFIEEGRLLRGVSGSALEIGHMTIQLDGRLCGCGNRGCLEAYASGLNIAARAREGLEAGVISVVRDLVDGDLRRISAQTVYEAIVQGDGYAVDVMTETATVLGVGIASLINLLNPAMVVLVGGLTKAGEHLFGPLRAEVGRRAFPSAVERCRVVAGELPDTAGVVGAAGVFALGEPREA